MPTVPASDTCPVLREIKVHHRPACLLATALGALEGETYMMRRSLLACFCSGILLPSCATGRTVQQEAPGPAPPATVIARLSDIPRADVVGVPHAGYLILIPRDERTRATPELLSALGRFAHDVPALFVGDPAAGEFDQRLSDAAIRDLNLDELDHPGTILILSRGPLTDASGFMVFVTNASEPAEIARSLRAFVGRLPQNPNTHWWPPLHWPWRS